MDGSCSCAQASSNVLGCRDPWRICVEEDDDRAVGLDEEGLLEGAHLKAEQSDCVAQSCLVEFHDGPGAFGDDDGCRQGFSDPMPVVEESAFG